MSEPLVTSMWGSKPRTFERSSRSKPVITLMTTMSTAMPRVTPRMEMSVMMETNVRRGLR